MGDIYFLGLRFFFVIFGIFFIFFGVFFRLLVLLCVLFYVFGFLSLWFISFGRVFFFSFGRVLFIKLLWNMFEDFNMIEVYSCFWDFIVKSLYVNSNVMYVRI